MTQDEAGRLTYRPDIDGLRALAILMVVGCHVAVPGMGGGFAGVDVFFVISGYLITALLLREQAERGRIDIAGFYARRVRRLLPMLGIVIAATLALGAGLMVLLPHQQVALAKSAAAALAFAANFHFWAVGENYFLDTAALRPLQHLWTLAVEEQFYLAWPLALAGLAALAARMRIPAARLVAGALGLAVVASLAASIAFSASWPVASFYLPHSRIWELGAGGLLALARVLPGRARHLLAPLGLAALAATVLLFDQSTPWPSWRALVPVLATVALIAAGPAGPVNRLLGTRPFVLLGKLSYGWYLWHWPLLAFARNAWGLEPALLRDAGLAALALLLAGLSWRWIETPVRERRAGPFRTTRGSLAAGGAILAACGLLAAGLWAWGSVPAPKGSILAQYQMSRRTLIKDFPYCDARPGPRRCQGGAGPGAPAVLLWGDSHATHLMDGLDRAGRNVEVRIVARTMPGCLPVGVPDTAPQRGTAAFRLECEAFSRSVAASIPQLARDGVRGVLLAGNWDGARLAGNSRLGALVADLRRAGLRVALAEDVPDQPHDFITCVYWRGADACAVPRSRAEREAAPVNGTLAAAAGADRDVRRWSPFDALCPDGRCVAVVDGRLLYRNRGHLTRSGSARLAPSLTPVLAWLAEDPKSLR